MAQHLEQPPLFNAKEAGERYQQALAVRAAELGYGIVPSRNGTFELEGVPRELSLIVQQPGQAIEARLAAGPDAGERQPGTARGVRPCCTRGAKPEVDRVRQRSQDRALARQHGLDLERFVAKPSSAADAQDLGRASSQATAHRRQPRRRLRAVREAAAILTERDAAFTAKSLEQRARQSCRSGTPMPRRSSRRWPSCRAVASWSSARSAPSIR